MNSDKKCGGVKDADSRQQEKNLSQTGKLSVSEKGNSMVYFIPANGVYGMAEILPDFQGRFYFTF